MDSGGKPPPSIPKSLLPLLARARELSTAEPVISYWCKLCATQALFEAAPTDDAGRGYLLSLIEDLEAAKAKAATEENDLIRDEAAGAAYVANFAERVFDNADKVDRSGKATLVTAKEFLAASVFLEVLSVFGPLDSEISEKIKYSKWKASSIAKAIREGRQPEPGPAGGSQDDTAALAAAAAATTVSDDAPQQPEETANTNGMQADDDDEDVRRQLLPDAPAAVPHRDVDDNDDGGDNAIDSSALPSAPEGTGFPTVPSGIGTDSSISPHALPGPPSPPPERSDLPPPPITVSKPALPPPPAVFPTPAPAPQPSAPPFVPMPQASAPPVQTNGSGNDEEWKPAPSNVDPTTIANAQKHAKWAISALNYEDLETARKELKLALQLIDG